MWIFLAVLSALLLGFYDIFKKLSVDKNNVLIVLFFNTLFCALLMSPILVKDFMTGGVTGGLEAHLFILLKSFIVLASWMLGYFSIKHLPLTIAGPINATRPIMVLVGALLIFGERLNLLQWCGVCLGFFSLYFISRLGKKEGISARSSKWLWLAIGSMLFGATSALYDKFLLTRYEPLQVQAWYSLYQLVIMGVTVFLLHRFQPSASRTPFKFRWTIPFIAIFLTVADIAYFYALSMDGAMISVISMTRRGAVVVSFLFGLIVLHEKNVKLKAIDLAILLIGLAFLVMGSH